VAKVSDRTASSRHVALLISANRELLSIVQIWRSCKETELADIGDGAVQRTNINTQAHRKQLKLPRITGWEGRFNPRSRHMTTKLRETAQRMSDTLQLVVDSSNTQPGRNYVINVDTHSGEVECWGRRRQAEAYRTFVEQCLGARVLCNLSGG